MTEKKVGMTDKDLELMRKRFEYGLRLSDDNRRKAVDDMKFRAASPDDPWQWPEDVLKDRTKAGEARPCLTINKVPQHVNQITNDIRQNRPAIQVLPVDDKADPDVAEVLSGVVRHIETGSDAPVAYVTAADHAVTGGFGYIRVLTEYVDDESMDQDIVIRRVRNFLSVVDDPDLQQPDGSDRKWCFVTEKLTKEEYEARYGDEHPIDWQMARDETAQKWISDDGVVIAEYWRYKTETTTLEIDGKSRKVRKQKVLWSLTNGEKELEAREWAGKYIPIARVVGNEFDIEGEIHTSGLVRGMKDAQRMYNYHASLEVESIALAPKAPFTAPAEAVEGHEDKWATANTVAHSYLPYNAFTEDGQAIPAPVRAMPPMPQQAILQAKLAASDDMKSTSSQYDASLGNKSNETSGVAIATRQRESDVATFHYIDNLSLAIKFVGKIILDLIPRIYDTRRVVRIIGEDGEVDTVTVDKTGQPLTEEKDELGKVLGKVYDLSVGRYDVRVAVGPSYTTKRQEAAAAMIETVRAVPQIMGVAGDLIVKSQDWPGSESIAERIKKSLPPQLIEDEDEDEEIPPKAKAMLAQAAQVVKATQEQMAAMMQGKDGLQAQAQELDANRAELKAAEDSLKAEQQVFEANKRAAEAELRCQVMEAEKNMQAQAGAAVENTIAQAVTPLAPVFESLANAIAMLAQGQQALAEGQQAISAGQERIAALVVAPRRSDLVKDANGRPVAAVSTVLQ